MNDDGSAPLDNPSTMPATAIGGEVGANLQKIYALRHPQQFRQAFDLLRGSSGSRRTARMRSTNSIASKPG
jgi:hypothetical protein